MSHHLQIFLNIFLNYLYFEIIEVSLQLKIHSYETNKEKDYHQNWL